MQPTNTHNPAYFHKVVDCQYACPAHTNVPEYLRLIAQGRYTESYLLNRESVNLFKKKVPSTAMGIELAAGVACSAALELLLGRGGGRVAPKGGHFAAYPYAAVETWRPPRGAAHGPVRSDEMWSLTWGSVVSS